MPQRTLFDAKRDMRSWILEYVNASRVDVIPKMMYCHGIKILHCNEYNMLLQHMLIQNVRLISISLLSRRCVVA